MTSLSVYKAFEIIEFLSDCHDNVGLRDLARELDMAPSTAHRFLSSLRDLGYIKQDPKTSKYRLSLKFAWLGARVLGCVQVSEIAKIHMEELTANTNETTHLAVLENLELVYVAKTDGNQAINMSSRIGHRAPLYSTAIGKVLLAYMAEEAQIKIIQELDLHPKTRNTITSGDRLKNQLNDVRKNGYAIDDEENEIGIRCIGAPIFDHRGELIAALSLSGWKVTMTNERMAILPKTLMATTDKISEELGYAGDYTQRIQHVTLDG